VKMLETVRHPLGMYGIVLWNSTHFPATRLIEFVSGKKDEKDIAVKVSTIFTEKFPSVKIQDSVQILKSP